MSASYPGDILPLWNPEIPGEEIQAGRLGIRIRPHSPAAAKLAFIPDGSQWLRDVLQEHREIDGYYSVARADKPLEFIGQVDHTLITGRLGRTSSGLALEITDMQQLESEYTSEKPGLRLSYRELQLVDQWDGELEGFTALELRETARSAPILDSTVRFIEHLRDYREQLAEGAVRRYEAVEQWIECPRCEAISPTSHSVLSCPECGEDLRGGEYVRAALDVTDGDARVYRGIDSLTIRSPGFPEYRGMTLDRVQGPTLWVSFRRYDPLPDEGVVLPTASVEMFDAQKSVIRQLQIGSPRTGALAALLADPGWLGSPPQAPLEGRRAHHLPDPNEEQAEAVSRVMGMRPGQLYLIQGPPGTGKTTAIVESIRRILGRNHGATILLSSHSNDAVDTGQERLLGFSHVRQARIAEPGKVPRRLRHTLVEGDDLDPYNLVAGTCNRLAIDSRLRFRVFDWLILDEANKVRANEALALMPLAKRWVFIGDTNQLPPVMEEAAMSYEIRSELDRVVRDDSFYGYMWDKVPAASRIMLPRQYRMREPIGRAVSDLFYGGRLIHEAPHQRMPLPWPFDREVVWVDTGAQDEYRDAQRSVANEFEVSLCKDITTIIRKRVRKARLAVIAMYSSQVNRLVSALRGIVPPDDIESVDAFEGRESDAVILSLVRSNDRAAIGFLNDPNRVNVAISRARKLLVIVGDSKTVIGGAPELFGPLFQHAKDDGLVAGVGAVVTACQRVGIRSQVQKLSRPKRGRRKRKRRKETGVEQPVEAAMGTAEQEAPPEPALQDAQVSGVSVPAHTAAAAESKPRPKRRTRRAAAAGVSEPAAAARAEAKPDLEPQTARAEANPGVEPETADVEARPGVEAAPPAVEPDAKPKRRTRRTAAAQAGEPAAAEAAARPGEEPALSAVEPDAKPKRRTRKPAADQAGEPAPLVEANADAEPARPGTEPDAKPRRRTRKPAAADPAEPAAAAQVEAKADVEPAEVAAEPKRRTRKTAAAQASEPAAAAQVEAKADVEPALPVEPAPKPKRTTRKPAAAAPPVGAEPDVPSAPPALEPEAKPKRRTSKAATVDAIPPEVPAKPVRRTRKAAVPADPAPAFVDPAASTTVEGPPRRSRARRSTRPEQPELPLDVPQGGS